MSTFFDDRVVAVPVGAVRRFGPARAIVMQQVHWLGLDADGGWVKLAAREWAKHTGLSEDGVHRVMRGLTDDGLLEVDGAANATRAVRLSATAYVQASTASRNRLANAGRDSAEARNPTTANDTDGIPRKRGRIPRNRGIGFRETAESDGALLSSLDVVKKGDTSRAAARAPVAEAFEAFWSDYPRRNGARVGKKQARAQWDKLTAEDRALAHERLGQYAAIAGNFPRDAERYLKHRLFDDVTDRRGGIEGQRERLAARAEAILGGGAA